MSREVGQEQTLYPVLFVTTATFTVVDEGEDPVVVTGNLLVMQVSGSGPHGVSGQNCHAESARERSLQTQTFKEILEKYILFLEYFGKSFHQNRSNMSQTCLEAIVN